MLALVGAFWMCWLQELTLKQARVALTQGSQTSRFSKCGKILRMGNGDIAGAGAASQGGGGSDWRIQAKAVMRPA